jgi:hypothetical protein
VNNYYKISKMIIKQIKQLNRPQVFAHLPLSKSNSKSNFISDWLAYFILSHERQAKHFILLYFISYFRREGDPSACSVQMPASNYPFEIVASTSPGKWSKTPFVAPMNNSNAFYAHSPYTRPFDLRFATRCNYPGRFSPLLPAAYACTHTRACARSRAGACRASEQLQQARADHFRCCRLLHRRSGRLCTCVTPFINL